MADSPASKERNVVPAQLLDLVHAPNPDNKNCGTPILDGTETDEILRNFSAEPHGAEEDERKYLVRRLTKVGTAAIDFVTLDAQVFYKPHVHQRSDSKIFITEGFGYLLLGKEPGDEMLIPYKPGDSFYVSRGMFHGFLSVSVTHFVSVNDPEILDPVTGAVDLRFRTPR
jgi:hypothetical protein